MCAKRLEVLFGWFQEDQVVKRWDTLHKSGISEVGGEEAAARAVHARVRRWRMSPTRREFRRRVTARVES